MDALERELRDLFDASPENSAIFQTMMKELAAGTEAKAKAKVRKPFVRQPPVIIYTEIRRVYHCRHCSGEYESILRLTDTETTPIINASGHVQILTSKSPAVVHCYTSFCKKCSGFVDTLSREELKDRYLELLKRSLFSNLYVQNMNIEETEEDERKEVI